MPKGPVPFIDNPALQERYLEHLAATGLKRRSAHLTGVSYQVVQNLRAKDDEFALKCEEALEDYRESLEAEAYRRAVEGVKEPIIGGRNKDKIVVEVSRYSDRLMEKLLNANIPDKYRNNVQVDANISSGVLVVPSKGMTITEWEKTYQEAAKGKGAGEGEDAGSGS